MVSRVGLIGEVAGSPYDVERRRPGGGTSRLRVCLLVVLLIKGWLQWLVKKNGWDIVGEDAASIVSINEIRY